MFSVRPVWIDVSLIWLSLVCLFVCSEGSFFKFGSGIFFFLASAVLLARPPFIASFFAFAHANCTHPFLCHAHDCSTIKGLPPRKCFSLIDSAPARTHTHTHTHTDQLWICSLHALTSVQSAQPQTTTANKTKNQSATDPHTKHTKYTKHTKLWGGGGEEPKGNTRKESKTAQNNHKSNKPATFIAITQPHKKKKTNKTTRTHGCKQAKRATALATNGLWLICCSMQKH